MTAIRIGALVFGALVVSFAAGPVRAQEATVGIDNFAFGPAETTVRVGTKVLFVNRDDVPHLDDIPHLLVLANGKARSKALDTDDSFAFVFDKPGEFIYFCGLHPQMKGKIIVTP
jgi:plastocyanin